MNKEGKREIFFFRREKIKERDMEWVCLENRDKLPRFLRKNFSSSGREGYSTAGRAGKITISCVK